MTLIKTNLSPSVSKTSGILNPSKMQEKNYKNLQRKQGSQKMTSTLLPGKMKNFLSCWMNPAYPHSSPPHVLTRYAMAQTGFQPLQRTHVHLTRYYTAWMKVCKVQRHPNPLMTRPWSRMITIQNLRTIRMPTNPQWRCLKTGIMAGNSVLQWSIS